MKNFLTHLAEVEAKYLAESDTPARPNDLPSEQTAVFAGAISMPDISMNKSNGSSYIQYRFGLALAGAHSDKAKSYETKPVGAFSGDPTLISYSKEEDAMIKNASDMVGAGKTIPLGARKSLEPDGVNKKSPHRRVGDIKLNRK
jgi:hypothetical protein